MIPSFGWQKIVSLNTLKIHLLTCNRLWSVVCGSVGRADASATRGPRFESSHWHILILPIYCQLYLEDENIQK